MNKPIASVVIPVFNSKKTIALTLDALNNQTIPINDFEVIVVDDGSTDNTQDIVRKYPLVTLIPQRHLGPALARNNGAKNANSEIIIFLDSDCVPEKNWLQLMLEPFKDEQVVGVQGAYKTKQDSFIAKFTQLEIEYRYKKMNSSKQLDWIATYSAAYRKSIFLEKKFSTSFKSASGEDPELSYRLQKKGFRLFFQKKAIVYHFHPTTLIEYLKKKFNHAKWRVLLYRMHPDKAVNDSFTPQLLKIQLLLILLFFFCFFLGFFFNLFFLISLIIVIAYIASMAPFIVFLLKRNALIGLVSPLIIFFRNIVFLVGLIQGFILLLRNVPR